MLMPAEAERTVKDVKGMRGNQNQKGIYMGDRTSINYITNRTSAEEYETQRRYALARNCCVCGKKVLGEAVKIPASDFTKRTFKISEFHCHKECEQKYWDGKRKYQDKGGVE